MTKYIGRRYMFCQKTGANVGLPPYLVKVEHGDIIEIVAEVFEGAPRKTTHRAEVIREGRDVRPSIFITMPDWAKNLTQKGVISLVGVDLPEHCKDYPHICPVCGARAYVSPMTGKVDCSKGCGA